MPLVRAKYDILKGVEYGLLVALLLWWLPLISAIFVGYVAGRKAGGPAKGMTAASIVSTIIMLFVLLVQYNIIVVPASLIKILYGNLISYASTYGIIGFAETLASMMVFRPPVFVITVIFGLIGGIVSMEAEYRRYKPKKLPRKVSKEELIKRSVESKVKSTRGMETL